MPTVPHGACHDQRCARTPVTALGVFAAITEPLTASGCAQAPAGHESFLSSSTEGWASRLRS